MLSPSIQTWYFIPMPKLKAVYIRIIHTNMKNLFSGNKFLLNFMFLAICGGVGAGISQIAVTLYAINLGANSSEIGLIQGVQSIGIFLTVLPMGFLVDHFGAKKIFIIGGLIGALIYLFLPLANTPQLLLIFTAVLGFFMSFRFVSMNSIFLDYLKVNGNEKAGWYRASHSIGLAFLGPILGGYLVKSIGYNWTFIMVSMFFVVAVITAKFVLTGRQKDYTNITVFSFNSTFTHIKSLLKNKDLIEASVIEGIAVIAFSCFTTFIVVIALRVFNLPQEIAALFISVQGIFFIFSLLSLGALLKKFGQRNFYLLGIVAIILGLILLGGAKNPLWLWPGSVFFGAGIGMLNLINVTRVSNIDGKKGRVAGVFSFFTVTGMILGPILGGFIGGVFGLQTIFLLLIPLFFILLSRIYFSDDKNDKSKINKREKENTLPEKIRERKIL